MAKKATKISQGGIDSKDLRRVIKESVRQKSLASEQASSAGGYIRGQIEKYNIEKISFGWVTRLESMEPQRKHEVVRSFLEYALKGGVFDQMDLFDDTSDTLKGIADVLGSSKGPRPQDEQLDALN